mgnify:CR=1 FL=1
MGIYLTPKKGHIGVLRTKQTRNIHNLDQNKSLLHCVHKVDSTLVQLQASASILPQMIQEYYIIRQEFHKCLLKSRYDIKYASSSFPAITAKGIRYLSNKERQSCQDTKNFFVRV